MGAQTPGDGRNASAPRWSGAGRRRGTSVLVCAMALAALLAATGSIGALAGGIAPTVETAKVNALARTSATLRGSVNPNGSTVTECYFEYGTSEATLSQDATCAYSPGSLETPVPDYASLEGLSESTTYYYRLHAGSSQGEGVGSIERFTTLPTAPRSNTEPVTSLGEHAATLNALVTPNDSEVTECFFEWGTNPGALSNTVPCSPANLGAGSEPVAVSAGISGLEESASYYYRVVAGNSFGVVQGGQSHFGTPPNKPRANTEPARQVAHTTATLRGFVTPHGALVEDCYFQWGAGNLENVAPCEPSSQGSGEEPVAVSAPLAGLTESTTYEFRLVALNRFGNDEGGTLRFTTLPALAKPQMRNTEELTSETALLRGVVNPEDSAVSECAFEYGETPALGSSASCGTLPSGATSSKVSAAVTGLTPMTTYHVRLRARNAFGVSYSNETTLTTSAAGLLPVISKVTPTKGSSAGGTKVTIKGKYLLHATSVTFGEVETTDITSDLAESITVIAPPGAGTVSVIVTTPSGESKLGGNDNFTYGAPSVTGVSPATGSKAGGTEVTITGTGFEPGTEATKVVFNKAPSTSVECSSTMICTVIAPPATKTGTVNVKATVNGRTSPAKTDRFTYTT